MCHLTPNMTYKVVSSYVPELKMPMYLGLCIYGYCKASFLNTLEGFIAPFLANLTISSYFHLTQLSVHD